MGPLITPGGLNVRLGRDSHGMPHLHGTFVHLLLDTGATIHVAGSLWRTRLKVLPGVGISTRAVGGGVSASPGQGTFIIDFAEATGALPTDLALFGTTMAESFPVCDVASVCAAPVEWPTTPYAGAAPGQVDLVTGADHPSTSPLSRLGSAKERRKSRSPPLRTPEAVAERLGITGHGVLCRSSAFLTGVSNYVVPPSYEPLGESCASPPYGGVLS